MEHNIFKNIIDTLKLKFQMLFSYKRENSPNVKGGVNNQSAMIGTQTNTQIGTQIVNGLSVQDAEHIAQTIVEKQLEQYHQTAKNIFIERNGDFNKLLVSEIQNLSDEERAKLADPDTQMTIGEGLKINGTLKSKEKRDILADLVIKRIKDSKRESEELKNIVYNEAIQAIKKLTLDQLKIITLNFLIKRTINNAIHNIEAIDQYLNTFVKPFLDFKDTSTEFEHIESVGCGTVQISETDILLVFKNNYSMAFAIPISMIEIQSMGLPEELTQELFINNEEGYIFNFQNLGVLTNFLNGKNIETTVKDMIINRYNGLIKDASEIGKIVEEKTEIGKVLISRWKNSSIKHLKLSSTGIAIAISHMEKTLGIQLDDNIWIK